MTIAGQRDAYGTTAKTVTAEMVQRYQRDGFIRIPGVITPAEAAAYGAAALAVEQRLKDKAFSSGPIFTQLVNVWREDATLRPLTLHPNVGGIAERLAGVALRLWHDHILIKQPHTSTPTEFHQDQPFWPHAQSTQALSAWIALVDVPVERGCMTFIPGSHRRTDLAAQDLRDAHDLFRKAPDLAWEPRVTVPLRAGDCTFHHARCAHMATPNTTDVPRVAHVVIYMEATTVYRTAGHPVTDPLGLEEGQPLEGPLFPLVREMR
ncbi:MAG: hypothetical protein NVSMB65_20680 [Chloroflexota bacterium]